MPPATHVLCCAVACALANRGISLPPDSKGAGQLLHAGLVEAWLHSMD